MGSYSLFLRPSAEKELRTISQPFLGKILTEMATLAEIPRPFGVKLLKGENRYYRIRQGDYRIIYDVDDQARTITVVKIGHRREIYDK